MVNLDSTDDVGLAISKIMDEQSKSFQTNLKDFQVLLDEDKLEEVILNNVLAIFQALVTLHKEQKIDSQEFKQRIESLINIIQLAGDVNANNIHRRKP